MTGLPDGVTRCGVSTCRCGGDGYVFLCVSCISETSERVQHYNNGDGSVGVTKAQAEMFGWRKLPIGWWCPYCCGLSELASSGDSDMLGNSPDYPDIPLD